MARTGDVIENPISGERMTFLEMGAESNGELLRVGLVVSPGGAVGAAHVHPKQDEHFRVVRGEMTLRHGGVERVLRAGDEATVRAGTVHEWWNTGDEELEAVLEFRPAGRFEEFISSYFGLAKAGHLNEHGSAGLLQDAVMLYEYRDTIRLAGRPMTNALLPVVSAIGRLLGLRAEYPYPRSGQGNRGEAVRRESERRPGTGAPVLAKG